MKFNRLAFLSAIVVSLFTSCSRDSFVKVADGQFRDGDRSLYYIGANFWYGAILASDCRGGSPIDSLLN